MVESRAAVVPCASVVTTCAKDAATGKAAAEIGLDVVAETDTVEVLAEEAIAVDLDRIYRTRAARAVSWS